MLIMEEAIHVGTESMGIFLYVQFFYEPKTFFKKKSLKKNNNKNLFVLKWKKKEAAKQASNATLGYLNRN